MIEELKRRYERSIAPFFERALEVLRDESSAVDLDALAMGFSCPFNDALEFIDPKQMHCLCERIVELSPAQVGVLKNRIFKPYVDGWSKLISELSARFNNLPEIVVFRDSLARYSAIVQGALAQQAVRSEVRVDLQLDYDKYFELKTAYTHIGDAIRRLGEVRVQPASDDHDPYNEREEAAERLRDLVNCIKHQNSLRVDTIRQAVDYIKNPDVSQGGPFSERCEEMRRILRRWHWRDSYIVQMAKPASGVRRR